MAGGGVGRGNASNGGGGNAGTASGEQTAAAIQDTAQGNAGSSRGLDSGLAKAAPKAEALHRKDTEATGVGWSSLQCSAREEEEMQRSKEPSWWCHFGRT